MAYNIAYRPEVNGDMEVIPRNMQSRIKRAIEQRLVQNPHAYGTRLAQSLSGLWKIRCGDYRIAYEIDDGEEVVTVWVICHRRHVYEIAEKRWRKNQ